MQPVSNYPSHGSCDDKGCRITATTHDSNQGIIIFTGTVTAQTIGANPPAVGSGSGVHYPTAQQKQHSRDCASAYGKYQPNTSKYTQQIDYEVDFGWALKSPSGVTLSYVMEQSSTTIPTHSSKGTWVRIGDITITDDAHHVYKTILFQYAYSSIGQMINDTEHECTHQDDHPDADVGGVEGAINAGNDAQNAYLHNPAGVGSKCGEP